MNGFDQRKRAFEAKYQHDEEMIFRVTSRRNHLFGLWVAKEFLDLNDDQAEKYSETVMTSYFAAQGDTGMITKVLFDLEKAQIDCTSRRLEKGLMTCHDQAREEIAREEGIS